MCHRKWICIAPIVILSIAVTQANVELDDLFGTQPVVSPISTNQLQRLLSNQTPAEIIGNVSGQESPTTGFVIVDVRESEEYNVSMIPGAITKREYENNKQLYADKTVVLYCTVGVRSLKYARRLLKNGTPVLNYRDGIVGWCENDLPLITTQGESTNVVHTWSWRFQVSSKYKSVW